MKQKIPHVEFTTLFNKQRKSAPVEIKKAFLETILLFIEDPDHPSLRNHSLKGKFSGYRSIDITGDYRAIFKESNLCKQKVFIFQMFGTHSQLYGS